MARSKPDASSVARRSTLIRVTLLGFSALSLGALLVLHALDVPLGQGSFVYRFSELQSTRTQRAAPVLPIAALCLTAIWLLGRARSHRRPPAAFARAGFARGAAFARGGFALAISTIALAIWVWAAPPRPIAQHMLNLLSPSHEGAFLIELDDMDRAGESMGEYLRGFDRHIQRSAKELLGTRVISNPPGVTVLFGAVASLFPLRTDPPGWAERILIDHFGATPQSVGQTLRTMQFALALLAMWLASAAVLYALGRMFFPPAGAAAFMLIAWFNPSTVHFSPGKDPAQLLTIGLMLLAWLAAWKRDREAMIAGLRPPPALRTALAAASAGAVLMIGLALGLIHLWIAAAALVATAWQSWRDGHMSPRWWMRLVLPAVIGAIAVAAVVYLLIGWNMPATFIAVTRRFAQVQQSLALSRAKWFAIGLPIFLLFASPGLMAFVAMATRTAVRRRSRALSVSPSTARADRAFGIRLAVSTIVFMAISYVVGVSYELPRLWVAFLPPLTLGVMLASPLARASHGRAMGALLFVLAAQLVITAAHWTLLDVREAEFRLTHERYFSMSPPSSTTTADPNKAGAS